jgi:ubiquinone/menaquinone biosynthesis C-methylase UbiE
MDRQKNDFDEKAKSWDDNPERTQRAQTIANAIMKEIPYDPSFTAMEYGCGTGLLSFPLKDRFSRITLLDNSQGMIDVLRNKIERSNTKNMDVLNIDLLKASGSLSQSFSVIYSSMVLHHIDDVNKILSVWHSLLTKPGYLCVADLDSDKGLFHGKDFKGHNGFDRDALKKAAEMEGFVQVTFRTVLEIQKIAHDGLTHSFPVFLMVCRTK